MLTAAPEPPSIQAISEYLKSQVPGLEDLEDEDDEEEVEGVDWMTDSSPEVKRWGEMANEYNTQPSEIAFLQVVSKDGILHLPIYIYSLYYIV